MKNIRFMILTVALSATVLWAQHNNSVQVNTTQKSFSGEVHPEMDAAIESLKDARKHLDDAKRDFDGHRLKAIKLIDDAIAEVKLGIASDK